MLSYNFRKLHPHLVLSWLLIDQVRILYIQSKLRIALEHFLLGCSLGPLGSTIPPFLRVIVSAIPQSGMLIRTGKNCGSWKCDARLRRNVATFQCLEVVLASEAASSPCAGPERKKGCFEGWVIQSDSTGIWSFAFLRYIEYHNSNDKSFYY